MKRILATFWVLSVANVALAGVYDMKFQRVAASNDQNTCRAFAESTSKALESRTGAKVIDHGCRADEFTLRGLDAVITYQADSRLQLTSTRTTSVYSAAYYASRAECEKHLDNQSKSFTNATGLPVLASYCHLGVGLFTPSWETVVTGIGQPTLRPEVAGLPFWGTLTDWPSTVAAFQAAAQKYGITLFEAGVDPAGLGRHLVLRYYAAEPHHLADFTDMKYENAAACATAASALSRILQTTTKPVVTFCESDRVSATLHVTTFQKIVTPESVYSVKQLTAEYGSAAACEKAASEFSVSAGVFGAVCAGSNGSFHPFLFASP